MASISNVYVKPEFVYRGGWRNWDKDAATGGQITMLKDDAELLSIFIGIFLVFVAAGLWTLIAYLIFQLNRRKREDGSSTAYDALYHQQQAILRNGSSDIAIGSAFLKLWFAWGNSPKVLKSTLPIVVLALVSFGFFLIALPFITAMEMLDKQGNQVLIKSSKCGFWEPDLEGDSQAAFTIATKHTLEAASYVDNCYETDAGSALCDQFLANRRLPVQSVRNIPCPFHESVCLPWTEGGKNPAITIQTDELDSHKDFGINSPPGERVKMRRSTTCSPLDVKKFSKVEERMDNENFTGVYFGPTGQTSYTYGASDWQFVAESSYTLRAFYSRVVGNTSYAQLFKPIPELRRNDADLTVVFLNNNQVPMVGDDGPCTDPFFSATSVPDDKLPDLYLPDNSITAIGCIDQYQFAKAGSDEWTPLASFADASTNLTFIDQLSIKQVAAYASIQWAMMQAGGIDFVIDTIQTEALRAKRSPGLRNGAQNPLPDDQWMREVEYWFMIGLAKVQLGVIHIALGPEDAENFGMRDNTTFVVHKRKNLMDYVCTSQKIHSLEFKNLHKAGFIALAVLGSLSIILPSLVLRMMIWWRKRQGDVLTWISYGLLQFQRMAAEGAGVKGWMRVDQDVPLLDPHNQPSGDVDVRNVGADGFPHPVWAGPGTNPTLAGNSVPRFYNGYHEGYLKDEYNGILMEVMPSGPEIGQGYGQRLQGGYNRVSGKELT
ncbi:hypothetical protein CEP54_003749 [Fusarium duplospermum]|uniref:Uncharacterized protein n=1 Tax=Fusarium duplospermum TaxID=1325734 RepID=A0A428QMH1_9HYPO|nr:hypothetical protein CEP54_003749 [Fusarium duplospermum]